MAEPSLKTKCRCGAPIKWVRLRSGKAMPCDPQPFTMVAVRGQIGDVVTAYVSHFATCPQATEFRGPGSEVRGHATEGNDG